MQLADLIIRGPRVVLPDIVAPRSIHIHDGKIVAVDDYDRSVAGCDIFEAGEESVIMPGLVDGARVSIAKP